MDSEQSALHFECGPLRRFPPGLSRSLYTSQRRPWRCHLPFAAKLTKYPRLPIRQYHGIFETRFLRGDFGRGPRSWTIELLPGIRCALRRAIRDRAATLASIGSLLLGIVCTTAVFSARTPSPPQGWPIRRVESSTPISALKQRLESGDPRALEQFWSDAARESTPLIEPASDNSREVIATFLWRGDAHTRNVALQAPLAKSPGLSDLPLQRLLGTDLWYGCWQMRDDLRFTYRFAPNLKPGENQHPLAALDPLNPQKMELPFEGGRIPTQVFSVAAMPRAPDERWIAKQQNVSAGEIERLSFKSAILKNERNIWVYTPPNYSDRFQGGYALLVLFDGFSYLNWIPAPAILDNLTHDGRIPPMVAVLIDNPLESRKAELAYNPAFADFVTKELLPWARARWNVTRDPHETIIGGYSLGGAAAAFVALRHSDLFGNVLSQSGAFQNGSQFLAWDWLPEEYEASKKLALRFFLEAGVLEDASKYGPTLLSSNRRLVKILEKKGYPITYEEVGGTHEPVHWRDTMADGLISLTK